jgi:glutamine synthetase
MTKYKLEYIWLDGYTPTPSLRGKTQIKEFDKFPTLEQLPLWGFDGSSTMQAEGHSSDCVLKPVAVYPDAARENGALVMCEVMMPDGVTPHASNKRATILDDEGAWFGFEQEYFFYKDGRPLGFPSDGYPAPQGPYYTGVGYSNVGSVARKIVEEHLNLCLAAGINHEGINAEVAKGQWEFQIFGTLPDAAPHRVLRHRHRVPLQAAWRHRLERLRHARQLLDQVHARSRRQGLLREADGGV